MENNKVNPVIDLSQTDTSSKRNPASQPEPEPALEFEPQLELELVLIRHGHTQWNKERRYLGSTDLPMLPEELDKLAELKTHPALGGQFWRVYCSDLRRCRETLGAIAPRLVQQAAYDSRLRELDFGAWEGCTYEQLKDNGHYRSWIDQPESVAPPEGEAWKEFEARVEDFWIQLQREAEAESAQAHTLVQAQAFAQAQAPVQALAPAQALADSASPEGCIRKGTAQEPCVMPDPPVLRVLLVTHGGIIRQLLARLAEGVTFYSAAAPPPGEITILNVRSDEGAWRMIPREV